MLLYHLQETAISIPLFHLPYIKSKIWNNFSLPIDAFTRCFALKPASKLGSLRFDQKQIQHSYNWLQSQNLYILL
jgi:hypothetical protein